MCTEALTGNLNDWPQVAQSRCLKIGYALNCTQEATKLDDGAAPPAVPRSSPTVTIGDAAVVSQNARRSRNGPGHSLREHPLSTGSQQFTAAHTYQLQSALLRCVPAPCRGLSHTYSAVRER
jgi:hypothetical protein